MLRLLSSVLFMLFGHWTSASSTLAAPPIANSEPRATSTARALGNEQLGLVELEHQLKQQERAVPDLIEGTEKSIRWFNGQMTKTPLAMIYLHGFSASAKEISPVPEKLADRLGANLYFARLTGHGRDAMAMLDGSVAAWLNDTRQAYDIAQHIGDRIVVVGTSTGATLGTWLSGQPFAKNLLANIMVSPNFGVASDHAWIMQYPLGLWLVKLLNGKYRGFEPRNDFHARYWTAHYPVEALLPMLDLVDMVNDMDKATIRVPQLMIYSPQDQVINVAKAQAALAGFTTAPTKQVTYTQSIDPNHHVMFGYGSTAKQTDEVSELMARFITDPNLTRSG